MTVLIWVRTTSDSWQRLPFGARVFVGPLPRAIPSKLIEVSLSTRLASIAFPLFVILLRAEQPD